MTNSAPKPPSIREILRAYDLDPKKSLGQNFLTDGAYLDRIADAAELTPQDAVLEIGPGLGALTARLADRAGRVVAVELDDRLIPVLRGMFGTRKNVEIIHGDILALDPGALMGRTNDQGPRTNDGRPTTNDGRPTTNDGRPTTNDGRPTTNGGRTTDDEGRPTTNDQRPTTNDQRLSPASVRPSSSSVRHPSYVVRPPSSSVRPSSSVVRPSSSSVRPSSSVVRPSSYKVVANLPYYITNAVVRHLLEASPPPSLAVVMVQEEVAERICAEPGDMSLLSVAVQFYAEPSIAFRVPASAFYPRPNVDSAVLRLESRLHPAVVTTDGAADGTADGETPAVDVKRFFAIVRAGFSQKRKQLRNSLSGGLHLSKETVDAALHAAGIDPSRRAQTLSLFEWARLYQTLEGDKMTR